MIFTILAVIILVFVLLFAGGEKVKEKQENVKMIPGRVGQWTKTVRKYANKYNIPFPVAMAVMWVESAGDPSARGSAGERGLYQLKEIAVKDLKLQGYGNFKFYETLPEENIEAGIAYLDLQRKRTGNMSDAIKAYNQGFAGMKKNPGLANEYLQKVEERKKFFQ